MNKLLRNLLIVTPIILWSTWPIIVVATASAVASAHGCDLNETSVNPCMVNGQDMGGALYSAGVMGWFMLVTIPTGGIALLVFLLLLLIEWIVARSRQDPRSPV